MPTKSSDSPRRTTRTSTRPRKAAETNPEAVVEEVASTESAPPRRRVTRRKAADSPASATESAQAEPQATAPQEDFGDGVMESAESSSSGSIGSSEGSQGGSSQEGEGQRGRGRRRRRRRPGTREESSQNSGGSQGGQRNRGGHSGGRDQGGRGGNTQGNRNRGGGGGGGGRNDSRNQRGGGRDRAAAKSNVASTGQPVHEIAGIIEGVLELHPKGYGFMRDSKVNYSALDSDAFVSSTMVEKYGLREGILIRGEVGPGTRAQGPRLHEIISIDGRTPEEYQQIKHFDTLTAINPFEQIKLETTQEKIPMRVMDLLAPIGKGQRALIVAPPRTGKTMLLQDIANSVSTNHPEVHLIVLLIDERPEEVTEMTRLVNGEVIASSMDRDVESHVRTSQLIIERGKRIAEAGGDAFILLDSITRTARAFNKWTGNTGRTMTGGLDIKAMDIPKKMFGTARRFDEGGSLTVVGTALIDTGSRMDEVIFQEFKGTGNMEMVLSRDLADRRIWPAIDISRSGTRREEKILDPAILDGIIALRRALVSLSPVEAMEELTRRLAMFPTNKEFLAKIRSIL